MSVQSNYSLDDCFESGMIEEISVEKAQFINGGKRSKREQRIFREFFGLPEKPGKRKKKSGASSQFLAPPNRRKEGASSQFSRPPGF